ncbi:MAG: F0F1 ATP synthase subunit epsilon [Chloroflexi bacterium]|nr:F0F1 ATP synthase subunit epsilon [Chloroflexota bacterium]MCL5076390.1 F0F1 ATP synthase subunit epsilon [Chloroflexota bacterium]
MAKIKLEIVTAERLVFSDEVDAVIAPGVEGQLGILPHHAPLLTALQTGELRVRKGDEEVLMAVSGGFMEVRQDKVIILADTAERAEEIDVARAEAARQRALAVLAEKRSAQDIAQSEAALRRSLIRLKIAERRRKRQR